MFFSLVFNLFFNFYFPAFYGKWSEVTSFKNTLVMDLKEMFYHSIYIFPYFCIVFHLIIPGHIIFNYILPKDLIFNNTSL